MTIVRAASGERRFALDLLAWFDEHGRRDLPWQRNPNGYRVWISEIMLQQTRVTAVIPYFERFASRFPDVISLAEAELDEVLELWSGLGYYARARNLHAAASRIAADHDGRMPGTFEELHALPGVGRSTAGAILALAHGKRYPILDGNAKRVLARQHAVPGWPGAAAVRKRLWQLAERHTPKRRIAAYTQAIMDLGATLCTRTKPACPTCPVAHGCKARARGETHRIPAPHPKRAYPVREKILVVMHDSEGRVLIERRPPSGIWGGLWSFPESELETDLRVAVGACADRHHLKLLRIRTLSPIEHGFTHFRLRAIPVLASVARRPDAIADQAAVRWLDPLQPPPAVGLAAPVGAIMSQLKPEVRGAP